jgi:hypothetical protein
MNLKQKRKVVDDCLADMLTIAKAQIASMKSGETNCSAQLFREISAFLKRADDEVRREELLGKPKEIMDGLLATLPDHYRLK